MTGGYLATFTAMTVTYLAGWIFSLTGWLGDAWAHITPGQAALAIGLLTYATHNSPKLFKLLAGLHGARRSRNARRE